MSALPINETKMPQSVGQRVSGLVNPIIETQMPQSVGQRVSGLVNPINGTQMPQSVGQRVSGLVSRSTEILPEFYDVFLRARMHSG